MTQRGKYLQVQQAKITKTKQTGMCHKRKQRRKQRIVNQCTVLARSVDRQQHDNNIRVEEQKSKILNVNHEVILITDSCVQVFANCSSTQHCLCGKSVAISRRHKTSRQVIFTLLPAVFHQAFLEQHTGMKAATDYSTQSFERYKVSLLEQLCYFSSLKRTCRMQVFSLSL